MRVAVIGAGYVGLVNGAALAGLGHRVRIATVGLWGLAFKAGTDDVRESPAVKIGRELTARGATVTAYDQAVAMLDDNEITVVDDPIEAARGADVLVVATVSDPVRRQLDISLARSALGWKPTVPLVDGLQRTIAYLRDVRS